MSNLQINKNKISSTVLKNHAVSGTTGDIDFIMENLFPNQSFLYCKLIDYALGLVSSEEGRNRIRYYLFNGSSIQRNYAALYFKRLGHSRVIQEAVKGGAIDEIQGYSR